MSWLADERLREYSARLAAHFENGGPEAARMPGLVRPLTRHFQSGEADLRSFMDASSVANCRVHGGEWELGVILMFRTHIAVDSTGGLRGVDDYLAELRPLSNRVGDRWMRAQVCSAAGEAAMARGRFDEAEEEYGEALRLAHEVSALTETPFLMARLAEIAYRSGDRDGAVAALDEAGAAAERYGVADSRAFILLLRAHIALEDGEIVHARALCDASRAETGRGTAPPQVLAGLGGIEAMVTAAECGPAAGLVVLADTFREAVRHRCSEALRAVLVELAADLAAGLGELPLAVRLLAAGAQWRGGCPRPALEHARAERTEAAARAVLGAERHEAEQVLDALARVLPGTPSGTPS
ncbi:hypothetical protein [Streptomyces sp. NPDC005423]|uniref:hypothetical protein n=1 Tax=Streptomyces sp. NPDC005423 TaxID=3155343 RepID=UPI0033AC1D43